MMQMALHLNNKTENTWKQSKASERLIQHKEHSQNFNDGNTEAI